MEHKGAIGMAATNGGRPSLFPTVLYADAKAAIRQLTEALGFTELSVYEGRTARSCTQNSRRATAR